MGDLRAIKVQLQLVLFGASFTKGLSLDLNLKLRMLSSTYAKFLVLAAFSLSFG